MKQLELLRKEKSAFGGELLKTRKGRARPRPIATSETMHLVLRSSRARGDWSFKRPRNEKRVRQLAERFAHRYGVRVLSLANVGNHLHFHVKLGHRRLYRPFIRALTGTIAMAVTGASRWNPLEGKFWDYRPFTRIIQSFRGFLNLRDYIRINQLEGAGVERTEARWMVKQAWRGS